MTAAKTIARPVRVRQPNATTPPASKTPDTPPSPQFLQCGHLLVGVEQLDGEIAARYLARNTNNRTKRPAQLAGMVRDMDANRFALVGDPIRFDANDDVVDGQHRLEALTLAEKRVSLPFVVIRGIDPADRHVIDVGQRRSAADQLRIAGYSNYILLAAAAKWSIITERLRQESVSKAERAVTHAEILEFVEGNELLHECVAVVSNGIGVKIDMPSGYICTAYYLTALVDEPAADEFIARLADGVNLPGGDPILVLREFLREYKSGVKRRGLIDQANGPRSLTGDMWLSLILRAWNARRSGETLRKLTVVDRNKKPYPVPEIL